MAQIVLQPTFSAHDAAIYSSLKSFNLGVTSLRLVLTRPGTPPVTVKDTTINVADGQDSILIALEVPVAGTSEIFTATMEMRSGTTLVFSGSVQVVATAGVLPTTTAALLIPVWVGPGKEATHIVISPRDQTLSASATLPFTATAFDANNQPVVDETYRSRWQWRVNDATLGSIPLNGGTFAGAGKAGTAIITVFTPNLLRDTVRLTLVTQLPLAKVKFARQLEVLNAGGTSTVAVAGTDANGATIPNATFTYTTRTAAVATVASSGTISGVAKGQTVIVVRGQDQGATTFFEDSLLAVVADPAGAALVSSVDRFDFRTDTTIVVSIFADMRATTKKLGSTTIDVEWNPSQLLYQSNATGASGVSPTVNASGASTGKLTLAMADVAGFGGRVELLRITFKTSTAASSGQLKLTAREMTAADFSDLLGSLVQVTHPLSVH